MQGKVGEGQSMEFRGAKNRTIRTEKEVNRVNRTWGADQVDEIGVLVGFCPLESKNPEVKLATEEAENNQQ